MKYGELEKNLKARNKKAAAEGRPFEDLFSAYQSEMIRQSIAYAENRAEKIYIYSDLEEGALMQNLRSALMENSIQTMIGTELYAREKSHLR